MPPAAPPPGPSLRAILDAAGRTPADVAARIGLDVAGALAAVQGAEGEGAAPVPLDAAAVRIGPRGEIALAGLGLRGRDAAADVRALGAVLHECLSGEPPGDPPRPLDVPGVPPALAAVVDRATGAAAPSHESLAALAQALAASIAAPATGSDVAAYADAVLPAAPPSLDAAQAFPAPAPARAPSLLAIALVALLALVVGFAIGFVLRRAG